MTNSITDKEAAQTLAQVKNAQAEITKQSAKEYVPWIGWGLFIVLLYPPFDFLNLAVWGSVVWILAILGTFVTFRYFRTRKSKIKTKQHSPFLSWLLYGLWIAAGNIFANFAHPHFAYAWTVAGLAIGLPFILYGLKLRNEL